MVTWNLLISGYLHIGRPEIAIELFPDMVKVGIDLTPNYVNAVLSSQGELQNSPLTRATEL